MAARLAPGQSEPVITLLDLVGPTRNMARDHRILAMLLRGQKIVQDLNGLADAAPVDSLVARASRPAPRPMSPGIRRMPPPCAPTSSSGAPMTGASRPRRRDGPLWRQALPISADIAALAQAGLSAMDAIEGGKPLSEADRAKADAVLARAEAFDAASARPLFSFLGKQPPADLIIKITPGVRALVWRRRARDGASGPEAPPDPGAAQRRHARAPAGGGDPLPASRSGYAATTTSLVAQRAGVSRGAMLHQFPTKVDLMLYVVRAVYDREVEEYVARLGHIRDLREKLLALPKVAWEVLSRPSGVAVLEVLQGSRSDPELAERLLPMQSMIETESFAWARRYDAILRRADLHALDAPDGLDRARPVGRQDPGPQADLDRVITLMRDMVAVALDPETKPTSASAESYWVAARSATSRRAFHGSASPTNAPSGTDVQQLVAGGVIARPGRQARTVGIALAREIGPIVGQLPRHRLVGPRGRAIDRPAAGRRHRPPRSNGWRRKASPPAPPARHSRSGIHRSAPLGRETARATKRAGSTMLRSPPIAWFSAFRPACRGVIGRARRPRAVAEPGVGGVHAGAEVQAKVGACGPDDHRDLVLAAVAKVSSGVSTISLPSTTGPE
jgi:AcrR family transcriptional regulator